MSNEVKEVTPDQIKNWLTNSYNSANEIIEILEEKYDEDENTKKMLVELKHHVRVLSYFY